MSNIVLEIENYNGQTICKVDLPFFDFADKESNEHFRFQSEHMNNNYSIDIIEKALKKALNDLKRWR